ncbi:MAG TPA: M20/M25/M40 family metallo-hydrolase [Gemmatimonadaceae bacterium]|nr:M20/M25/M40 family metallo-hydrolase [Gemmatimonadaceae bacterium]
MKVPHAVRAMSIALASATVAACAPQPAVQTAAGPGRTVAAITPADLRTRLYIYADDSMQGREAGTIGDYKATAYIASELARMGLEPAGDNGTYFQDIHSTTPRFNSSANPDYARNVVAILRGSDPVLRNEYVAIGAHNDHIGIRHGAAVDHDSLRAYNVELTRLGAPVWDRSSRARRDSLRAQIHINVDSLRKIRPARLDSINNGADDDGSGTVTVLEIAEALNAMPVKPKRSILFVWHTGEEKGLLGSKWFTDNPTVPREQIVAQLNMDMVGRGSAADIAGGGPDYLQLVGSRRVSTELGDIVEAVNSGLKRPFKFDYQFDANGHPERIYCRSDHYEYARYGIPITFFTTGLHPDYHQVTDEPQYIDYEHMSRVADFVKDIAIRVANLDHRPKVDKPAGDPNAACVQ